MSRASQAIGCGRSAAAMVPRTCQRLLDKPMPATSLSPAESIRLSSLKDKAACVYPVEHYAYWHREFPGMTLPWGMFGENLTTEGLQEARPLPCAQRLISVYPRAEADGPKTTQSRRPAHISRISQQHQS
jgi:hypothetical protein